MSLLDSMPHVGRHDRLRYEQDPLGGNIDAPVQRAAELSCWVQNASFREIEEFQKRDQVITHKVFFPTDPNMRPGDTLTITGGPSFVGRELHFRAFTDRSAGLGVVFAGFFEEENNLQEGFDA